MTNLALAMLSRFEERGESQDLEDGISILRNAIVRTPSGHPGLPARLTNLSNMLGQWFGITADETTLAEAIAVARAPSK
jgi:hypothetical protein